MNLLALSLHIPGVSGIIGLLIHILALALVVCLVLWVLGLCGVPQHIRRIIAAIVALVIIASLLSGCAETRVSLGDAKHAPEFRTAADASRVHLDLTRNRALLDIDGMNHSAPTDARGRNITRAGNAGSGIIAAAAAAAVKP